MYCTKCYIDEKQQQQQHQQDISTGNIFKKIEKSKKMHLENLFSLENARDIDYINSEYFFQANERSKNLKSIKIEPSTLTEPPPPHNNDTSNTLSEKFFESFKKNKSIIEFIIFSRHGVRTFDNKREAEYDEIIKRNTQIQVRNGLTDFCLGKHFV